jgi:hypothetical protein
LCLFDPNYFIDYFTVTKFLEKNPDALKFVNVSPKYFYLVYQVLESDEGSISCIKISPNNTHVAVSTSVGSLIVCDFASLMKGEKKITYKAKTNGYAVNIEWGNKLNGDGMLS